MRGSSSRSQSDSLRAHVGYSTPSNSDNAMSMRIQSIVYVVVATLAARVVISLGDGVATVSPPSVTITSRHG